MKLYLFVVAITAAVIFVFSRLDNVFPSGNVNIYESVTNTSNAEDRVEVTISGQVRYAGNYFLANPATLRNLVEAAGGLSELADDRCFNLDIQISNKGTYYIAPTGDGKISINSAIIKELTDLPGIGMTYAERIIEYRDWVGGFKHIDELMKIQGIGVVTFDKIKDLVYL